MPGVCCALASSLDLLLALFGIIAGWMQAQIPIPVQPGTFAKPRSFRIEKFASAFLDPQSEKGKYAYETYSFLVQINLFWGLVNLLPVWPLDGGQIAQILLTSYNRSEGQRWGHVVSLLVAGALAVVAYMLTQRLFLSLFFGYFALVNYQVLQTLHQAHSMGLHQDDDWWRK